MDFIDKKIQDYAEAHTVNEPDYLYTLNRFTHTSVLKPRMLSGHLQGRFLSMLSKIYAPQYILDIGTYTGYSALCLAEGLQKEGKVHTIESNEEMAEIAKNQIAKTPFADEIVIHVGFAMEQIAVVNKMVPHWDIVWIDAEKSEYAGYYEQCIGRVRKGGLIMADNVLWSGKVTDAAAMEIDEDTRHIDAFNKMIQKDERVSNLLLPVRDGIMMMQKL